MLRRVMQPAVDRRSATGHHLQAQYEIVRAMAESQGLGEAMERILAAVCVNLDWELGAWWALDPESDTLRSQAVWPQGGRNSRFVERTLGLELARGVGLPGLVVDAGRPLWFSDVATSPLPRADAAVEAGIHSAFGFPLIADGEITGVLEFFSGRVRHQDRVLLEVVGAVGVQIGAFRQRILAEDRVRRSEARQAAILEAALDCIVTIDHDGTIVDFNPAAEQTFGYTREQAVGQELGALIVPADLRERHRTALAAAVRGDPGSGALIGRRVELRGVRADGSELPVELTITRVSLPGPPLFTGYLRDISERRRLLEREQAARAEADRLSTELQAALLPSLAPQHENLTLVARSRPGEHRLMLGGDFYDAADLDDGSVAVVIGDVSGHGPQAAALGANLRAAWHMLVRAGSSPEATLELLDGMVTAERTSDEFFATVAAGWIGADRRSVRLVSAGHPWPLLLDPVEQVSSGVTGPPLGASAGGGWPVLDLVLEPRRALLFYTDGLIEERMADGSGRRLGLDGLITLLAGCRSDEGGIDALLGAIGPTFADDMALLLVCPRAG
jgi:PAS domain S-box-containing protein